MVCSCTEGMWGMRKAVLMAAQAGTEWGIPQPVADLPSGGIASIAAGARASAAVTADGQLWMWGRLMAADNARWAGRQVVSMKHEIKGFPNDGFAGGTSCLVSSCRAPDHRATA